MRRTARVLSAAALACAALGVAVPAAADPGVSTDTAVPADPAAPPEPVLPEDSADAVGPGVPEGPADDPDPVAPEDPAGAVEPAVPGDSAASGDSPVSGSAAHVSPGSVSPGGSVTVSVSCDPVGGSAPTSIQASSPAFEEGTVPLRRVAGDDEEAAGPAYTGTARIAADGNLEGDENASGKAPGWSVDGTCPAAHGGKGKPWSARFDVAHGGGAGVQHGAHAGAGGTFTDSVPALAAGGVLIAGAFGGAVYRLRRKSPSADG